MSTELYIQGYSGAGEDGLHVDEILKLFRVKSPADEYGFFVLRYDALNHCDLHIVERNRRAIAVTMHRPCGHFQFWEDILSLLAKGPYLAFMPGSPSPVLVNTDVTRHTPEDLIKSLGVPLPVATPDELRGILMSERQ